MPLVVYGSYKMFAKQLIINDVNPCHLIRWGTSNQILAQRQTWQVSANLRTFRIASFEWFLFAKFLQPRNK